jgi:rubrerythrin
MMRKKLTLWQRFVLAFREIAENGTTNFIGPCGHNVNGDPSSWWCPVCGASGSSG